MPGLYPYFPTTPTFGDTIDVTSTPLPPGLGPSGADVIGTGLPGAGPTGGTEGPQIDLRTQPGTGVFGEEAEENRRKKLIPILMKLLQGAGLSTRFLDLLQESLSGGNDPFSLLGTSASQVADLAGIPTLPTPLAGATRSAPAALSWQPGNPMSSPTQFEEPFQLYRPDLVQQPPGLLQALHDLLAEAGLGQAQAGTRGGGQGQYSLPPELQSILAQFRSGGGSGKAFALGAGGPFRHDSRQAF